MTKGEPCRNHGLYVCARCVVITDAARRMADLVNAMITFKPWDELVNGWMAFRLDNGGSDGVLYESRTDCIRHQADEMRCAYFSFRMNPGGVNAHDCQVFLNLHRHVYDNGGRLVDPQQPEKTPDLILSHRGYDFMIGRRNP